MKTTKVENRNSELINTIENAQKLAKEQENPSYTKMFLPWVEQVAERTNTGKWFNYRVLIFPYCFSLFSYFPTRF